MEGIRHNSIEKPRLIWPFSVITFSKIKSALVVNSLAEASEGTRRTFAYKFCCVCVTSRYYIQNNRPAYPLGACSLPIPPRSASIIPFLTKRKTACPSSTRPEPGVSSKNHPLKTLAS